MRMVPTSWAAGKIFPQKLYAGSFSMSLRMADGAGSATALGA